MTGQSNFKHFKVLFDDWKIIAGFPPTQIFKWLTIFQARSQSAAKAQGP